MSEVELLKQHLENRQETEAKLLLDLLDGQSELFSSDVKTLVKSLAERGDFQLMVELFSPVLQKRSGEILERLRDLPIPLMLYVISNVLVEMSVAVERLGDIYFHLHCEMLRAVAKRKGVQLSSFGAFGKACISALLTSKK